MSPVSRGRKRRKGGSGRGPSRGADAAFVEVLRAFQPFAAKGDPFEVELFASSLVGMWWNEVPDDQDPDLTFGIEAVEYAARRGTPAAMALLRGFAAVGAGAPLRRAASEAAAVLRAAGVADPPWAAAIGRVEVGDCWQFADVYGDQASLQCEFAYEGVRHAVIALLDFNYLGGWVKDVWVTDEPDETLAELRERTDQEAGTVVLERIDPARARYLLESGIAVTDTIWPPEVAETFPDHRAFALARCRVMPEPAEPAADPPELAEPARAALVAEFLGSTEFLASADSDDAADAAVIERCAGLIVDFGVEEDNGRPLRVSPVKSEVMLLDWALHRIALDEAERVAMPAVLLTWTRWAARRAGLADAAVAEVLEATQECATRYTEEINDPDYVSFSQLYLAGIDVDGSVDVADVAERRRFAVPEIMTSIGGEEFGHLDPGDPDDRDTLIEGEHPQWHHLLGDPSFGGEVDGVSPRLHLATHAIITNQLWDGDPPEAWQAVKRLRAAGVDRHNIFHQLGGVAMGLLHGALVNDEPVNLDGYRKALDALGRPESRS